MRHFRYILAALFMLAAIVAAAIAANSNAKVNSVVVRLDDPRADPKYAAVANLDVWQAYKHSDQNLVREFDAANSSYQDSVQAANAERSIYTNDRSNAFVAAVLAILFLGISLIPWEVFFVRAGEAVSDGAGAISTAVSGILDRRSDDSPIIGRESFGSFSVADELLKWKSLFDAGVIDEQEFDKARHKLLNRKEV